MSSQLLCHLDRGATFHDASHVRVPQGVKINEASGVVDVWDIGRLKVSPQHRGSLLGQTKSRGIFRPAFQPWP